MRNRVLDLNFFLKLNHVYCFPFGDFIKEITENSQNRELIDERKDYLYVTLLQCVLVHNKSFLDEGSVTHKTFVVVDFFQIFI